MAKFRAINVSEGAYQWVRTQAYLKDCPMAAIMDALILQAAHNQGSPLWPQAAQPWWLVQIRALPGGEEWLAEARACDKGGEVFCANATWGYLRNHLAMLLRDDGMAFREREALLNEAYAILPSCRGCICL